MNAQQIQDTIAAALPCQHLQVLGDDGRHWYATIVSERFAGKRLIQRHQMVYAALGDALRSDAVHAFSMKTHTPDEWAAQGAA